MTDSVFTKKGENRKKYAKTNKNITILYLFQVQKMETKIDYEHHLLQSRPNFAKALKDFETFLLATTEDLQNKFRVLESQKSHRKTSRNLKTYLSLQNYLLNKHLTRLHEFQNEIYARVAIVFAQEDLKQNGADEQFLSVKLFFNFIVIFLNRIFFTDFS